MSKLFNSNDHSDEEKIKNATAWLETLVPHFPDYSDFELDRIIHAYIKPAAKRTFLDNQDRFRTILYDKGWATVGTFPSMLKLTDAGRAEKTGLIEQIESSKRKIAADKNKYSFNDYMNATLLLLAKEQTPEIYATLLDSLKYKYPYIELHEILTEVKRLNLAYLGTDTRGNETFLLQQPTKKQIQNLPNEFDGKPYEYFLDEERKEKESVSMKNWYETEIAKKQFEDYPETKLKADRSFTISVVTILLLILTTMRELMCTKPD